MKKIILLTFLISFAINAQIKLPRLISDGMILQRDTKINIWGWASPKENIELDFKGKKYKTITAEDGKWTIQLPSQKAGGPFEMTLKGINTIVLKNILFGDVWLCSGQSNMELPMDRLKDKYKEVITKSENSKIRQFLVPDEYYFEKERNDFSTGAWVEANPQNVLQFTGVGYFFALEIYEKYKVPIGLINSALGGSPAESWINEEGIKKFPEYYQEFLKFKDGKLEKEIDANDRKVSSDWYKLLNDTDLGLKNKWKNTTDVSDWKTMNIPGYWADGELGNLNGPVWFKKEFTLGKIKESQAKIILGRIVDADSVFVNGSFVGTTSYQYPPRIYFFNSSILKEGKNEITIRVINNSGRGGFVTDKPYELIIDDKTIDLKGSWNYKLGSKMLPLPGQTFVRWKPVGLYNAMIAPIKNYSLKGVLWYQGEANTKKPLEYTALMETLINTWRTELKQEKLPFLLVQLPNFMDPKPEPTESNWAVLRQQQSKVLEIPNTGMAVAIDLGEWNDIHPLNKSDVGKRLALQARKLVYGEKKLVTSGPIFKSMEQKDEQLVLSFDSLGTGLMNKGGNTLNGFAVAGADGKFVWAKATIEGDKVMVWNNDIRNPVKVRYAWADNPFNANLYNQENLPASPFEAGLK
ncbi:sialate O-acetylesterase [Flavobacterium quisquiliarum]|uniref:Sialate O-acetylesterase n=1 Tax=Flavobacterium quisquiliarum TaxID=1834436 RepID=A0ABV8WCP8_9FLAO|nr:sialate O-acetylesterase [Flavobacterium quisquiliarum]MBW1654986.1 sialate O-acetylesterase [Flavobacterium quisquiliarum]NWL00416.1 sialate O-acetylesterase [Flavobacterium collinsii]